MTPLSRFDVALFEALSHALGVKSVDLVCPGARLECHSDHSMRMRIFWLLAPGG